MELYNLRHPQEQASFCEAVRRGIGRDQGLFFPRRLERLREVEALLGQDFVTRSQLLLRHLIGEELPQLAEIVEEAFSFEVRLAPVTSATYALELFHGPTLAFKDFGARFLARVLAAVKGSGPLTILTATSGDTGAAVADAFYDQPGIAVVVLYPRGRISAVQEKMISTLGHNIHAVEIEGSFDECQDLVKQGFADEGLRAAAGLNSANSINIARLLAQVCYYFEAVAQLPGGQREQVVFSVPCGNFGNLCAGLIARALGLPCSFMVACNANDTIPRFLDTGRYEPHATVACMSNAMDISRPNNWPRVEELCRQQGWQTAELRHGSVDDLQTAATMQDYRGRYLLEPHAAVACRVLDAQRRPDETGIFLATAHPAKFKADVDRILGIDLELPPAIRRRMALPVQVQVLPASYPALRAYLSEVLNLGPA